MGMCRRAGMLPFAAIGLFLLFPAAELTPQGQTGTVPSAPVRNSAPPVVRLEHQLIEVQPPKVVRRSPRARVVPPATRLASAAPDVGIRLVARARRAFVGDGRYRPEPFPRLHR